MTARVYTHGERLALGASATSVHWIAGCPVFALGDGSVLARGDGKSSRIRAHEGAVLCATSDPTADRLITGGDDGRLVAVDPTGAAETLAEYRGKWIDHVVSSPVSGLVVASIGKEAKVFKKPAGAFAPGLEDHSFTHPSTIGGLALDTKGRRVAITHYGGATVRYALMPDDKGMALNWAGSHLAVTISPDADYIVTAMQENSLHGWRLPERTDIRMSGYAAKTRSFSWDKRGRWLATSGADRAIVWPFVGKLGPQGKAPLQLAPREALVTAVAFHPGEEMLAVGYADGAVEFVRFSDQAQMSMDEPGEGPVSALAWSKDGAKLAIGDQAGRGAIVSLV